jgi:hypothetical protein
MLSKACLRDIRTVVRLKIVTWVRKKSFFLNDKWMQKSHLKTSLKTF